MLWSELSAQSMRTMGRSSAPAAGVEDLGHGALAGAALADEQEHGVCTALSFLICWMSFLALALRPISRVSISFDFTAGRPDRAVRSASIAGIRMPRLSVAMSSSTLNGFCR